MLIASGTHSHRSDTLGNGTAHVQALVKAGT